MWALSAVDSADEAMIDVLAGLESDGYQMEHHKALSHHRSLGSCRNSQNSDDEENEPQCEKEEMELSLIMSQRWDSSIEEPGPKRRYIDDFLYLIFPLSPSYLRAMMWIIEESLLIALEKSADAAAC